MKISVSRAMKEKARMLKELNELISTFSQNVYSERYTPTVNVLLNYDRAKTLKNNIVTLKKQIARANVASGASNIIVELTECKSFLSAMRRVSTNVEPDFSRNPATGEIEKVKKMAFISPDDVEREKQELQKKIYSLQDKLDELNATTFIDFSPYED